MPMNVPVPGPQKNPNRWLGVAAIVVLLVSSLACRLEFGMRPEVSAQAQPPAFADYTAANGPASAPAPADRVSTPSPTPTARPTVTPTASPTPYNPILAPTVPAEDQARPTSTPGIPPTPTPIPLIPARYPPHRIIIPAIGLNAPVETADWTTSTGKDGVTSVWNVPENAAGWHKNSALPGHGNNVVLSGHHNLGAEVFRDLVNLKVGDELVLQADAYEYHYVVTDRFIVPELNAPEEQRQQNAQWILPTIDERVTLVTCWPYTGNSHRLIVVAKPVGFNEL
mgnify:CR=1 FL=1